MDLLTCQYETYACLNVFIIKHVVSLYQCTFGNDIRNRPASVLYYNTQGSGELFSLGGQLLFIYLIFHREQDVKLFQYVSTLWNMCQWKSFALHYVSTNHSEQIQRTFSSWGEKKKPLETLSNLQYFSVYVCVCMGVFFHLKCLLVF